MTAAASAPQEIAARPAGPPVALATVPVEVTAVQSVERATSIYEPSSLSEAIDLAKMLAQSDLVPRALRGNPANITLVVMAGKEIGLGFTQSMRLLNVIDGKIVQAADLIVALVKREKICVRFRMLESTSKVARYETQRRGDTEPTRLSWTIEQAALAGLLGKDNWKKHPDAMLRARCSAALARIVYPDLVAGMYDPDEADEIVATVATQQAPTSALLHASPEARRIERETAKSIQAMRDDLNQFEGGLAVEQLIAVWIDHRQAVTNEAGGELAVIEAAMDELLSRSASQINRTEFNWRVQLEVTAAKHPAFRALLAACSAAEKREAVATVWREHAAAIIALGDEPKKLAWQMAYRRAAALDTTLTQPGKWLKVEVEAQIKSEAEAAAKPAEREIGADDNDDDAPADPEPPGGALASDREKRAAQPQAPAQGVFRTATRTATRGT